MEAARLTIRYRAMQMGTAGDALLDSRFGGIPAGGGRHDAGGPNAPNKANRGGRNRPQSQISDLRFREMDGLAARRLSSLMRNEPNFREDQNGVKSFHNLGLRGQERDRWRQRRTQSKPIVAGRRRPTGTPSHRTGHPGHPRQGPSDERRQTKRIWPGRVLTARFALDAGPGDTRLGADDIVTTCPATHLRPAKAISPRFGRR